MKEITTDKNILRENSDLLKKYFKDISLYPVLSSEKQIELSRKAKAGDEIARKKLIESNLRFVVTCAKQYSGQGVPLLDLINAGNLGLIQSIENFDPDKGYKFISFAVWYIRREILKAIYNTGRTIRYPITYISKITKVKKAYDKFLTDNSREPTDDELIELTDLTKKQYSKVISNKSYCESLDKSINEDGKTKLEDVLYEPSKPFSDVFTIETISKSLRILNPREYKVITEFYGLDGQEERAIKDIALEMNLGDERVRQIRKDAVKKLRRRFGNILKTLL